MNIAKVIYINTRVIPNESGWFFDKYLTGYLDCHGLEHFPMLRRAGVIVAFVLIGATLGLAVPAFAPDAERAFDTINAGGRLSQVQHTVSQIAVSFVR